jgi:hypothetical protein
MQHVWTGRRIQYVVESLIAWDLGTDGMIILKGTLK